jgi:hypothetical protein
MVLVVVLFETWVYVGVETFVLVLELCDVLTSAVLDGVALTETLTDAGLVGTAVLVGARVDSEVRAPERE